jgi:hypothetical protein
VTAAVHDSSSHDLTSSFIEYRWRYEIGMKNRAIRDIRVFR